jgi:hypothetical protein
MKRDDYRPAGIPREDEDVVASDNPIDSEPSLGQGLNDVSSADRGESTATH